MEKACKNAVTTCSVKLHERHHIQNDNIIEAYDTKDKRHVEAKYYFSVNILSNLIDHTRTECIM